MAYLRGTAGGDVIAGTRSRDTIDGFGGGDILFGGGGVDFIYAGDGDDVLVGGGDRDQLYGGRGADHFDFNAVSDSQFLDNRFDTIHDFSSAAGDKIDLSTLDADASRAGNQAFTFGEGNDGEGRVWTVRGSNDLRVKVNVAGDGDPREVMEINLNEFAGDLSAGDFIL